MPERVWNNHQHPDSPSSCRRGGGGQRREVGADLSGRRREEVTGSPPGLSRRDNGALITGCLKRQLCKGLREQTDPQGEGFG